MPFSKVHPACRNIVNGMKSEVSSIMRELAGRSLTGTYLYSLCVKPERKQALALLNSPQEVTKND